MDDYIYVYEYVQSVRIRPEDVHEDGSATVAYLLDYDDKETTKIEYKDYEKTIYSMIDDGKVDTYKWTFKSKLMEIIIFIVEHGRINYSPLLC